MWPAMREPSARRAGDYTRSPQSRARWERPAGARGGALLTGIDVLPQSGLMGRRQRRRHACRREVYPRHGLRRGPTCETPAAIAGSSRATSRSLPGDAVSCTGAARRAPGLLFALPGRMGPIWLDLRISGQPAQDGFVNNRHQLPPHADINGQASHGGIELWVEWRRRFLVVYLKPRRGRGGGQ